MIVGYARTSTTDQWRAWRPSSATLEAAGEQTSSVGPRKALEEALDFIRRDDV